jgi:hypothetical protein
MILEFQNIVSHYKKCYGINIIIKLQSNERQFQRITL